MQCRHRGCTSWDLASSLLDEDYGEVKRCCFFGRSLQCIGLKASAALPWSDLQHSSLPASQDPKASKMGEAGLSMSATSPEQLAVDTLHVTDVHSVEDEAEALMPLTDVRPEYHPSRARHII